MKIVHIQSIVRTYLTQRNFLYALQLQRQQAEQLEVFSSLVELRGETAYNEMVQCQIHDRKRAVNMVCYQLSLIGLSKQCRPRSFYH